MYLIGQRLGHLCETRTYRLYSLRRSKVLINYFQANLTELKSFGKPPPAVVNVTAAVMVLLAPPTKIPKDRSWNAAKVMMGKVSHVILVH